MYVLADLFCFVYERPVPSFFHDFVVFNVLRICFLFSINDVYPDPLNSPGELSSRFFCFLLILYTTKELHALNIYLVLIKVIILTIKFVK